MGIKASQILEPVRELIVDVNYFEGGQAVKGEIKVRHRVITPTIWENLRDADAEPPVTTPTENTDGAQADAKPKPKNSLINELLKLLVSWDIEADDGSSLPINEETLRRIDYKVLQAIDRAIVDYTFPDTKKS